MNLKDNILLLLKLGWRNSFRAKRRSYLVISAAFFGSLGVLFTLANLNAFLESMISMTIEAGLGHVQIRPKGFEESRKVGMTLHAPGLNKKLQKTKGIKAIKGFSPRFEREGMIRAGTGSQGVLFTGVDPERETQISNFPKWTRTGRFFEKKKSKTAKSTSEESLQESLGILPCIIGSTNAKRLELDLDDFLVLSITNEQGDLRSVRARIVGIYESPSDQIDKYNVILRRSDLSRLYAGRPDLISYWVFRGRSLSDAAYIQSRLQAALGTSFPIEVLTYAEVEPSITRLFDLSKQMRWIVHLIMMIGFALILFDSVSMSVFDRMREIGVIRAIGSSSGLVFGMVLFESLLLAFLGSAVGIAIGGGLTTWLYLRGLDLKGFAAGLETMGIGSVIYPYLGFSDILETLFVTLSVAFLSAFYPALKAVRIDPVRAIYHR